MTCVRAGIITVSYTHLDVYKRQEMERVDADGSKVQKVWEDLISQEMPSAEAVTETLGRILKEGKEAYETMEAEETALRKESEQLHLMIGKKEEINRIFGLLERTESEYKRLQEQSAEYELLKNHALLGERSEQARRLEVQALRTKEDARRIKEEIVTLNEWMEEHSKRAVSYTHLVKNVRKSFGNG